MKAHLTCAVIILFVAVLFMCPESRADPLKDLKAGLPEKVSVWKAAHGEDRSFDRETIFDYIDGAGEVYRAYNMRRCLSRRYSAPDEPPIVLDLFDMGGSEDAFGVFTHDRDGEVLDMGQGALYRPGWLSFWKDRFFISIYAEWETPRAEKAVKELGRIVASLIRSEGEAPRILLKLPPEGLQSGKTRYLHNFNILNFHFYISDENILNLDPETDAVLAEYRSGQGRARLLLVLYPNEKMASEALSNFFRHFLAEADKENIQRLEDGKWYAAFTKRALLAVILEATTRQYARGLLQSILEPDRKVGG